MFTVDRAAVEAEVARRRAILETSHTRWIIAKLAMSLVAFYGIALVIRIISSKGPLILSSTNAAVFLGVPAFMAVFVTWMSARALFRPEALDVDRLAAEVGKEVERLTGDGWPLRTLGAGLSLAAIAGVPVAVMLWVTRSPIARSLSIAAILVFVSGMMLWAIVMAFVIRFATLYLYRRMVRST